MTEKILPIPETPQIPNKEAAILAGGVIDEKQYEAGVKKLAEENNALRIADIHSKTHTDLIALRIQSYENRDLPSTKIDDAFRVISDYGDLKNMPKRFPVKIEQINELIYEMLVAAQKNLSGGITAEDVTNIGQGSIENFHSILRSVGTTKEKYEDIVEDARVFGRQFARTLQEKRKTQETK